jgi:hypothetical protein
MRSAEIVYGGSKIHVVVDSTGFVLIDGEPLSYEEALRRLVSMRVIHRVCRTGRSFCGRCRLAYPKDVWGDIRFCIFCGTRMRTHPRSNRAIHSRIN